MTRAVRINLLKGMVSRHLILGTFFLVGQFVDPIDVRLGEFVHRLDQPLPKRGSSDVGNGQLG